MSITDAVIMDLITVNLLKTDYPDIALIPGALAYRLLYESIKKKGLGVGQTEWNLYTTAGAVLIGMIFYKEELSEKKMIGVALGIAGIYFMNS